MPTKTIRMNADYTVSYGDPLQPSNVAAPRSSTERVFLGNTYGWLEYQLSYVTKQEQLPEVLEWIAAQKAFLLDTETGGLDPFTDRLATVQIGNPLDPNPRVFVIDVRAFLPEVITPVLKAICDPSKIKLGQNIKFEYKFMRSWYGVKLRNVKDTQVAEILMRAGLFGEGSSGRPEAYKKSSMAQLAVRYLGIGLDKGLDVRLSFDTTAVGCHNTRQLQYAAGDVIFPAYIYMEQMKEIRNRGLEDCLRIEQRFIPVVAEAEMKGFGVDVKKWRTLYQEALRGQAVAEANLHTLLRGAGQTELFEDRKSDPVLFPKTGKALNFNSPDQVKYIIKHYCEAVRWPVKIVTSESELLKLRVEYGASSRGNEDYKIPYDKYCLLNETKADALKLSRALKQLPTELINALLDISKFHNPTTTFGNEFIVQNVGKDGRIHTEFHQLSTDTGRMSSSPNLQNIPRDPRYRECFVPSPGYKFIIADYSQIEPRISAQVSQDPIYLTTFKDHKDIYLMIGEEVFGQKIDKNTEQGAILRQIAKVIVLAMAYRMGWYKLWKAIVLALEPLINAGKVELPTYAYVQELHATFLAKFSKLVAYQNFCSDNANPSETPREKIWDIMASCAVTWVEAPCGRKRFFLPSSKNTYTEGSNAPIQGHSATIMKVAAVLVDDYIYTQGLDATIVNFVHDEMIVEAEASIADALAVKVKELMQVAGEYWLTDIPVIAEFPKGTTGVVDCWTK